MGQYEDKIELMRKYYSGISTSYGFYVKRDIPSQMINEPAKAKSVDIEYDSPRISGATTGGVSAGAYGTVNKSYDEEKFHARQGHGFVAERANHLHDKLTRKIANPNYYK